MVEKSAGSSYLQAELKSAERALQVVTRKIDNLNDIDPDSEQLLVKEGGEKSILKRLRMAETEAEEISFVRELSACASSSPCEDGSNNFVLDGQKCFRLGQVLVRQGEPTKKLALYNIIYKEEYLPWYGYVQGKLTVSLRRSLSKAKYPSKEGCQKLLKERKQFQSEASLFTSIAGICECLQRIESAHQQVLYAVNGYSSSVSALDPVLMEICGPILERIRFHFLEASDDRPTSMRIDRLPEWLILYVRDNVLEGGPWELLHRGLAPFLASSWMVNFLNELVRIVQWVLGERGFFRHEHVAGPASKPSTLCDAIEHLIRFDADLQELVPQGLSTRLLSLIDIFVAGDEELLSWWLERERERVFTILTQQTTIRANKLVAPQAESFAALIRSVRIKAAVFSFSGPYLNRIATPLCMYFLDTVQEIASDLQSLLVQRTLPSDKDLESNILEWIELINGTHLVTSVLSLPIESHGDITLNGDEDLRRFGISVENLENALIGEFRKAFVESLLMERAKLASYLMRCPHFLALSGVEMVDASEVSVDLGETQRLLSVLLRVCDLVYTGRISNSTKDIEMFAPEVLRDSVLASVADKFLMVALDVDGMTPDLMRPGALTLSRDILDIFGTSALPSAALRLLDVVKFMCLEARHLGQVGDALCGLAEESPPLTIATFTADERLYEEALSMLRAKGFTWIELEDTLSILNRRRDLRVH